MTSRFTELVVDCHDPARLADFWRAVLDYQVGEVDEEAGWITIEGEPGSGPSLIFQKVPEEKVVKNRLHIDVSPRDREQDAEVERIVDLGAKPIDIGQGETTWVVMADPEGNEFCVLRTRHP
jgi:predicted enzyme related to lactoylglutathione lyase